MLFSQIHKFVRVIQIVTIIAILMYLRFLLFCFFSNFFLFTLLLPIYVNKQLYNLFETIFVILLLLSLFDNKNSMFYVRTSIFFRSELWYAFSFEGEIFNTNIISFDRFFFASFFFLWSALFWTKYLSSFICLDKEILKLMQKILSHVIFHIPNPN